MIEALNLFGPKYLNTLSACLQDDTFCRTQLEFAVEPGALERKRRGAGPDSARDSARACVPSAVHALSQRGHRIPPFLSWLLRHPRTPKTTVQVLRQCPFRKRTQHQHNKCWRARAMLASQRSSGRCCIPIGPGLTKSFADARCALRLLILARGPRMLWRRWLLLVNI